MQAIVISLGCVFVGVLLGWSALAQLRSGVTLSGRGGPSGPIRRDDRPGYFWFLFWVRALLAPMALAAGLAGLAGWW